MDNELPWKIIHKYFEDNKNLLVKHHLDSYNDFFNNGINRIFKEKNPIKILKQQNPTTKEYDYQANIYLGGKEGDKIYYGKPIIYDEDREQYMYPNIARLRNMTYAITIHYDVLIEYTIYQDEEKIETTTILEKIFLGRFPIMVNSDLCILHGLDAGIKYNLGECLNDLGGYFIIDGKEKVIISQEKFADNMLYIKDNYNELYSHSAEIRSVSEDASKPMRTVSVRIVRPSEKHTNNQIVVNIPNVRKPIPLFIVMRALGIVSDYDIIKYCLLDLNKYSSYIDLFIPSIHDAGRVFTQEVALKYIATFTKGKTIASILEILINYFLPHIGETNFQDKAFFMGHIVIELLKVFTKENKATDRDSFKFKRVELPGYLLYDLFKEYYTLQQRNIFQKIDKEYYYKQGIYQNNFTALIENNYKEIFNERIVEKGFKKAFKGNWGAESHTKKSGVVQDLSRLSFNAYISHLRKINLPLDASAKVVAPRLLHGSQWGIIDPVDTPDGGNIGLHKHMALGTHISSGCSSKKLIEIFKYNFQMKLLTECPIDYISKTTKIFINGRWIGIIESPIEIIEKLKQYRRLALIPIYTSIFWNKETNVIYIYTDSGRLLRPIFYVTYNQPSYQAEGLIEKLFKNEFSWEDLVTGFNKKLIEKNLNYETFYTLDELYKTDDIETLSKKEAIIDFMDTSEAEGALICMDIEKIKEHPYTHMEIHPSLILGVMGNLIAFPESNQLPRDLFSCGQSKQAVSLYHSNFLSRIDKTALVLNYGQIPLIKSRYLKYINNEQHPYGINAIVAIGIYGSYNVEDSILFNEGAINRGLFRTTYYNSYESYEENSKIGNATIDSKFANIENETVIGLRPGYDYSNLDEYGLIKENTELDDKKVLIGKISNNSTNSEISIDNSVFPKKGQLGFVDKSFITEGEQGTRIAKVRIREERIPAIGDKFCSRCGQKGTIGLVIPEDDMPFTSEGIRPDIIINPHALPSRMTISQLVESLEGKVCCEYGAFGDATAFINKGPKEKIFGDLLTELGYSSTGNEILYNGQTGEQLEAAIFIGPTYYMRLKHIVKDKINYRARGPRTVLTRQTVQGRANDGGLRIGEMERDGVIAHGMSSFLHDSLLNRGDSYYMAICNNTGTIAIYNETKNLFLSPMADGPIKFTGLIEDNISIIDISKFGRNFSVIQIPYAFKLLMQELQTMNVAMRIITEDNIDQFENMAYSNNINLVLGKNSEITSKISSQEVSKSPSKEALKPPREEASKSPSEEASKSPSEEDLKPTSEEDLKPTSEEALKPTSEELIKKEELQSEAAIEEQLLKELGKAEMESEKIYLDEIKKTAAEDREDREDREDQDTSIKISTKSNYFPPPPVDSIEKGKITDLGSPDEKIDENIGEIIEVIKKTKDGTKDEKNKQVNTLLQIDDFEKEGEEEYENEKKTITIN